MVNPAIKFAAFVGLIVLPFTASAESSDVNAQRHSKLEKCLNGLVQKALENPDLTPLPNKAAVSLGLLSSGMIEGSYVTRQAFFVGSDGLTHALAVSSTTPDKLLFLRGKTGSFHVFVTSRMGDFITGGTLANRDFSLRNDPDFRLLGEAEVRLFLTHAYPSGNCTAAYVPRH